MYCLRLGVWLAGSEFGIAGPLEGQLTAKRF